MENTVCLEISIKLFSQAKIWKKKWNKKPFLFVKPKHVLFAQHLKLLLCHCKNMFLFLLSTDVAGGSVCPPAALDLTLQLLCGMFKLWGQLGAGILTLMQWLMGEEDGCDEEEADEALPLVSLLL